MVYLVSYIEPLSVCIYVLLLCLGEFTYTPITNPELHTSGFNIPSVQNNIDKISDDKLLIIESIIDDNRKASDKTMKKYYSKIDKQDSKLENLMAMIKNMMDHNQNSNYSP